MAKGRAATLLGFCTVEVEITPEPSDEERAAILAALAIEDDAPFLTDLEEPEP